MIIIIIISSTSSSNSSSSNSNSSKSTIVKFDRCLQLLINDKTIIEFKKKNLTDFHSLLIYELMNVKDNEIIDLDVNYFDEKL